MATVEIGPLDEALAELGAHCAERVEPMRRDPLTDVEGGAWCAHGQRFADCPVCNPVRVAPLTDPETFQVTREQAYARGLDVIGGSEVVTDAQLAAARTERYASERVVHHERVVDSIPYQLRVDAGLHALWIKINRLCEWTAVTIDRLELARDALVKRMCDLRWHSLLRPLDRHCLQNADYTPAMLVTGWEQAIDLVLWARVDSTERNDHRSKLGAAFAAMSRWLRVWAPIYKRIGEGWSRGKLDERYQEAYNGVVISTDAP